MFGSSKPAASLSSGLLARKGQARPAMRPQGFHGASLSLDDLGWNDMGEDPAPHVTVAPAPMPLPVEPAAVAAPVAPSVVTDVPSVLVEREALREELKAVIEEPAPAQTKPKPKSRPVSIATAARIDREVRAGKPKAAFTLRLDSERHLKLRLASATCNRSAQALVTEALDAFLASLPEVESLAAHLGQGRKAS